MENARRIIDLAQQGIANQPHADLIVAPETAFPPSISYYSEIKGDGFSNEGRATAELLAFNANSAKAFILGNDHASVGLNDRGQRDRLHYNAAVYLEGGKMWSWYAKQRLVPGIEYFPFYTILPHVHESLDKDFGPLWTPGDGPSLFLLGERHYATPICYEDCFGSICREMACMGADVFIPISSDAWSCSEGAMRLHLCCTCFRAAELRRPIVKVSNNGVSCLIGASGMIEKELPAFKPCVWEARPGPKGQRTSLYMLIGDLLPQLALLVVSLFLTAQVKVKTRHHSN